MFMMERPVEKALEKSSAGAWLRYPEGSWDMSEQRAKPLAPVTPQGEAQNISTVRPPFDPLQFARDSERKVRISETDPPSTRPTAPPPPGMPQYQAGLTSGTMQSLANVGADTVPQLAITPEDLEWFDLPEPTALLLVLIDGVSNIGSLSQRADVALDVAMATFHELARDGIVTLRR
jgi:hypothetical protein